MHVEDLEEQCRVWKQAKQKRYAEHLVWKKQMAKENQRLKEECDDLAREINYLKGKNEPLLGESLTEEKHEES
jgi:hypothetical protein